MFTQKLFKTGNSTVITVPKQILELLKIKEGEEVVWVPTGKTVTLEPKTTVTKVADVDAKFMKMVEEFADEHEDVLKELAKR